MAQQTINIGASPNDGTGTPLRTAFQYTNSNFSELYTAVGPSGNNIVVPGNATITGDLTVDTNTLKVDSANNRVGINTASPALPFVVSNAGAQGFEINPNGSIVSGGIDILSYNRSTSLYKGAGFAAESYLFRVGTVSATDAMTLNATGLGIGVTPSASWVTYKALEFDTGIVSGSSSMALNRNCYFDGVNWRYKVTTSFGISQYQLSGNGNHIWNIASSGSAGAAINGGTGAWTQAMTLDASGNLLIGTTSSPLASRVSVGVTNGQPDAFVIRNSAATAGLYWRLAYVNSANTFHILNQSGVGVYLTDGATSWTGTSDERLKDIIEPISNAVAKVGSLRSVIGKFKTDSEGTRRSFLIAQDVQAVLPEAVDTTNADAFGVRYSEVIPLLVAAIKELTARVKTLETR